MHPAITRNTLITGAGLNEIAGLTVGEGVRASIWNLLTKFQDIKSFASEIHTETHLIRPMLKLLGYAYESKPKFFEDHVKGPDAALFSTEGERVKNSRLWGTDEYYRNSLGILLLKRYGRNLHEGISGFYLEFENRIPLFQTMYLLKKARTPWGILTDGRHWILMKRPMSYETRLISMDIEGGLREGGAQTLDTFYSLFSLQGITTTVPQIMERERTELISLLKERKQSVGSSVQYLKKDTEVLPKVMDSYKQIYPDVNLPETIKQLQIKASSSHVDKRNHMNDHNRSAIAAYLYNRKGYQTDFDLESIFLKNNKERLTKEQLLSCRILDLTPNFGSTALELVEALAYFSFILPYKERNTFMAEWENELLLKKYIIQHVLFGVEKSCFAYDILHSGIEKRFGTGASNYRLGNPLIGMSLHDLTTYLKGNNRQSVADRTCGDIVTIFKDTYRQYSSLSEKIKEDVQVRADLSLIIEKYSERIRDIMDIITSNYFNKTLDSAEVQSTIIDFCGDDDVWSRLSSQDWFAQAKSTAEKYGFFHYDLEFPFLLEGAFDYIFVQPSLQHIWEEPAPFMELTKAYIKRGTSYLKDSGAMIIIAGQRQLEEVKYELNSSKRYSYEPGNGYIMLRKSRSTHL